MRDLNRHCLNCNRLTRGRTLCARCEVPRAAAYGRTHRKYRDALIGALRGSRGVRCGICGLAIRPDETALELDHGTPVADGGIYGPKRLVHAKCNSRRGGIRGTTYTPRGKR